MNTQTTPEFKIGQRVKDLSGIEGTVVENPDNDLTRVQFTPEEWRDLNPEQLTEVTPGAVKHTPEWKFSEVLSTRKINEFAVVTQGKGQHIVCYATSKEYAEEIAQVPTMKAEIEELTRQRDELIEWIKNAYHNSHTDHEAAQEVLRNAINSLSPTQDNTE